MINYQFNSESNILETTFSGTVSVENLKNYMQKIHDKKDLPRKLKVIIDASNVNFEIDPTHSQEATAFNYSLSKKYEHIKTAIISNDPKRTAMLLMYQYGANSKNYEVKLFVLKENALKWLSQI